MTICEKCRVPMKMGGIANMGVIVERHGKWYSGDRLTCPKCDHSVIANFGAPSDKVPFRYIQVEEEAR